METWRILPDEEKKMKSFSLTNRICKILPKEPLHLNNTLQVKGTVNEVKILRETERGIIIEADPWVFTPWSNIISITPVDD